MWKWVVLVLSGLPSIVVFAWIVATKTTKTTSNPDILMYVFFSSAALFSLLGITFLVLYIFQHLCW